MADGSPLSAEPGAAGIETRSSPGIWAEDPPAAQAIGLDDDSESEWEYEYSSHETETYYLAVDLSYPEFTGTATRNPHHSRGGYYKNWLDHQPQGQPEASAAPASTAAPPRDPSIEPPPPQAGGADDTRDDDARDSNTMDDEMIHPSLRGDDARVGREEEAELDNSEPEREPGQEEDAAGRDGGREEETNYPEATSDIQILDLHSKRPLISYRGHVFEGQWAEMIGTDIILTRNDGKSPNQLPALRHLPGGVDLLGASASRILTKRKTLQPRLAEEDSLAMIQRRWNINIRPGKNKHGERAQQANFLEKLIALKIKRGDEDRVTVYAQDGLGKDFDDNQDPDSRPRKRRTKKSMGSITDGKGAPRARMRRSGRPTGRPRTRRRGTHAPSGHSQSSHGAHAQDALSVPTPQRWDELEADEQQDDASDAEDESDSNMDDNEDEDDDDNNMDDDDDEAPDDADTTMAGA